MCSSIDSSRSEWSAAAASPVAVPISQHTTVTPSIAGISVTSRSGSAVTGSAPAASISGARAAERLVPRTACPAAASSRASAWPRQPQPTSRTRAMEPPKLSRSAGLARRLTWKAAITEEMTPRPRHPGLHDARGNEIPHRLLDVRGVPTFLYDSGGDAPPVVLIHGYGDTADGWRRVTPGLLTRHRVIALDVPPFGRSGEPDAPKLLDFYKQFFPELFEQLEIESATVIGHSLGGATALHVALERPELVERLGLVAPAGLGQGPPGGGDPLSRHRPGWPPAPAVPPPLPPPPVPAGA